jgi:hypothetical protein
VTLASISTSTQASAAGVSSTAKSQIRKFFYDETQANAISTGNWIAFVKTHSYPGLLQTSTPLWKSWEAKLTSMHYKSSFLPDLSTVDFDPSFKWVAGNCRVAAKTKPKGTTYIVTIDYTTSSDSNPSSSGKVDIHVTIWNGKVYYYQTICFE